MQPLVSGLHALINEVERGDFSGLKGMGKKTMRKGRKNFKKNKKGTKLQ